jgi:intein/homing endonuclease
MKGTLFSADFVKDLTGNLRLLELNTDTAFTNGALTHVDFTEFINLISDNNINEVHVIHKEFHKNFVQSLSQSLNDNGLVDSFLQTEEGNDIIYPTAIEDSSTKFILRCAYDESAIFDSTYCKQKEEVLKLFYENDDTGSIVQFFVSSSNLNIDTLQRATNSSTIPDVGVKNISSIHESIKFYKIGGTSSVEDNFNQFIESNHQDSLIVNYYDNSSETRHKGIRSFNIIYGSNLDILNLANVEVDAIFDKPTSMDYDLNNVSNLIHEKHYYELTSNFPQLVQADGGIFEEEYITDANDEPVLVSDIVIGNSYKSIFVSGSPDTDNVSVFTAWFHEGSELPVDSYLTSSILINTVKFPLKRGLISNITTEESASFRAAGNQHILVYDSSSNELRYKTIYRINEETDYLLKSDDGITKVISNDVEILEDTHYSYILDFEDVDTFVLHNSGLSIKVVAHNACFPAGTKIQLVNGDVKNIEDIEEGDTLVSFDTHNKKFTTGRVGKLNKSTQSGLVYIKTEFGEELKSTLGHTIYSQNGWVTADKLVVGDSLINSNGDVSKIVDIGIISGEFEVYHILNVGNDHTYFANDILVHNRSITTAPPPPAPNPPPPPGYVCFIAGTKVTMEDGSEKNIEDVVIDDVVLSYNEDRRCIESKKVIKLQSPIHDDLVEYTLSNGTTITSTFDHPYYVNGLQLASYKPNWTNSRYDLPSNVIEIQVGDLLNLVNNEVVEIISINELDRVDTQTYIFSVEGNRNFYANGILVHNK